MTLPGLDPSSIRLLSYHKIVPHKTSDELSHFTQIKGTIRTQAIGSSLERVGALSPLPITLSTLSSHHSKTLAKRVIATDIQAIYASFFDRIKTKSDQSFRNSHSTSLTSKEQSFEKAIFSKYNHSLNILVHDIAPRLKKYQNHDDILSIEDTAALSLAFEKITKQLPKSKLSELSRLLAQHIKSDWLQMERDHLKESQLKELEPLGKPGASLITTYNLGINAGASLLAVPGTETKVGPYADLSLQASHGIKYRADAEGKLYKEKRSGIALGLKGGVEASIAKNVGAKAELGGKVQYDFTSFKGWSNIESYVDKKGHKINSANRKQYRASSSINRIALFFKNQIPFKPGSELKRFKQELQLATNNQDRLNDLLQTELGIDATVNAPSPIRSKAEKGFSHTWTGAVNAIAQASTSIDVGTLKANASASLALTRQKSIANIYKFTHNQLADVINTNSVRLKELPQNMTKHARDIMHQATPEMAMSGLTQLEKDVNNYFKLVKQYDALKSSPNKNKGDVRALQQRKHQIEDKWGAIGRHQFLQFTTVSHALFASIIMPRGTLSESMNQAIKQDTLNLIERVAMKVQRPEIGYSKKRLDKIASFQQVAFQKETDTRSIIKLTLGPFSGQIEIFQRDLVHANRVREGQYIDVTLTGSVAGSLQGLIKGATITAQIKEAAASQGIELPGDLDISPDLGSEASIARTIRFFKPKYSQADDYSGEQGWRKQFTRDHRTFLANTNLESSSSVAPGVSAGGNIGITKSKTTVLGEVLGTNDLTYTETRFNRFFALAA